MSPKKKTTGKGEDQLKQIEELESRLKEAEEKAERYMSQLKYARADLENLQKQSQKRAQDIMDRANGGLLQQLLPVLDELEIISASEAEKERLVEGLRMVTRKLQKVMDSEGVKPIEADGRMFDPFKHEAILEVETDEEPDGYVLEEVRKGYTFKDRVLRASVVKVARSPRKESEEEEQDE